MRRKLSGVVKYCWPLSWSPPSTSHSRNSALSRPSACRVMRPVTSAWALMARQSAKRGATSVLVIFSMKAAGSIGANSPLRLRLPVMIWEMPRAASPSAGLPARKSGSAIGIGCTLPSLTSTRSTARAGRPRQGGGAEAGARRASAHGGGSRVGIENAGRLSDRDSIGVMGGTSNVVRDVQSAPEHFVGIEFDFDLLPRLVLRGRQPVTAGSAGPRASRFRRQPGTAGSSRG